MKIPGLSKLRIGGSIGKAAEKVKSTLNNTKIAGIPLGVGLAAGSGGGFLPVAQAESSRTGGDLGAAAKNFGQDLTAGARNLPFAVGASKLLPGDSVTNAGGTAGGQVPGNDDPSSDNTGELDPATEDAVKKAPGGQSILDQFKIGNVSLGDVLDFAKKYAPTAIEVLAAKAAHDRQAQSDKYAQQGLALAQEHYGQNQPLRDSGRSGMLSAGAYKPDLTKLNSLAGSGYSGPGSTLPMATPRQQPGTLPIAAGPPIPTPAPSGIGPRMPLPSGPPQPQAPGAPPVMPQNPGTLPIAGMPPLPNLTRKPTIPFAQPGY